MKYCSFLLCLVFSLGFSGCNDFFVSPNSLDHISLNPQAVLLKTGDTVQISASAVTVDGTSTDITQSATWSSAATGTATVNSTGLVTAVSTGTTTISASQGSVTGNGNVIVRAVGLQTTNPITITASSTQVASGSTLATTATANFTDGSTLDITPIAVWSSSSTATATVDTGGVIKGVAAGNATITATVNTASGAVSGSFNVTVF